MEEREEGRESNLPIPRPSPQRGDTPALGWCVIPDRGESLGLESEHHDEDGKALRAHWDAAHRDAVAALDPGSNASRGGTKEGTVTAAPEIPTAVSA
jgi:hypothetical protein